MKRILIALVVLIVAGCSDTPPPYSTHAANAVNPIQVSAWRSTGYVDVAVIDGCQYLAFKDGHGNVCFCHKGNCNNPIHPYNVERK